MEASIVETVDGPSATRPTAWGALAGTWGVVGVLLLLFNAVFRLSDLAVAPIRQGLSPAGWGIYLSLVFFLAYTEGYRAFQLGFSPRVVARAVHLARRPVWWHALLAPAYCMGFFHATRKRKLVAWGLTAGVIGLIVLVRALPDFWRGSVDAGVVVALTWGMAVIVVHAARAAMGYPPAVSPDLPDPVSTDARTKEAP